MLVIVAHHYVVNSGITQEWAGLNNLNANNIFLMLFGWGGKIGINCFVLITGYFMCTSNITLKKFLKLILEVYFYRIIFYLVFILSGYQEFTIKGLIKLCLPFTSVTNMFTSAYLLFFLFIPFLNFLIKGINKEQHFLLMSLCLFVYTIMSSVMLPVTFNYVTWFSVIYIIGSYIRFYPEKWFASKGLWGWLALLSLILSMLSVVSIGYILLKFTGTAWMWGKNYFFVNDSNKILAVTTAVTSFMYFKNINIGYKKWINTIAASAFGVLLIHANSDSMRQWLWKDTLNNVGYMNSNWVVLHAFGSVIAIYVVCTLIDMLRIKFFEKPFFKWYDKRFAQKQKSN